MAEEKGSETAPAQKSAEQKAAAAEPYAQAAEGSSAQQKPDPEAKKQEDLKLQTVKTLTEALQSAQISLDNYDDIFSDFDPSPYESRILSEDFLVELGRRYAETKTGDLLVNFTLPHSVRSEKTEALVKKRIRDYFKARLAKARRQANETRKKGLLRIIGGVLVLTPIMLFPDVKILLLDTMLPVLSWYLFWTGFDNLLEVPARHTSEIGFCERFIRAKYNFLDEEAVVKSFGISSSYR